MIGSRLRQLRLARNLTLEALAAKMGGIVTKQALSKYETDRANPSPVVLTSLANALGVRAAYFMSKPAIRVEFVAYRSKTGLRPTEAARLRSRVQHDLEARVAVLELLGKVDGDRIPVNAYLIDTIEDAEAAAGDLRRRWQLGLEPVGNVTEALEDNLICIFGVQAGDSFDGTSAKVYDEEGHLKTVAVVTRNNVDGVRQRLNLAHELGHLVMDIRGTLDEETVAFRFGAAFLAPASKVIAEVGESRETIQLEELLLLKKRFGISVQALVRRLLDLNIITESYYFHWRSLLNKMGWKRHEPQDWPFEESDFMKRHVLRLLAERAIESDEAEAFLTQALHSPLPESLIQKREFLKLPMEKRREILAEQAGSLAKYYAAPADEKTLIGAGDFVDH